MKKILWYVGIYLLLGGAVLVWTRRKADPVGPIWGLPTGADWQAIALWPLKLLT